ncbi:hypothetical protein N7499_012218 [Penicillium canescens]|nr:hypothetical protein N7499_012218 [Penicillium canescens]
MPGRTTVAKRKRFETDNSVSELSCLIGITDSSEANTNERTANTNSNDDVVADLLRNPKVLEADIIAIPEPWDNPSIETTHHSAKQTHELVFPSTNETGGRARRRQDENGEQEEIRIVNVYNPVGCIDTIAKLEDILGRNAKASIIVGALTSTTQPADANADALIELIGSDDLDLWLAPGTITRDESGHQITINLVFGSHDLSERFLATEVTYECHAHLDHLPMCTAIEHEKFDKFVASNLRRKTWQLSTPEKLTTRWTTSWRWLTEPSRNPRHGSNLASGLTLLSPLNAAKAIKVTRRLFRRYTTSYDEGGWE